VPFPQHSRHFSLLVACSLIYAGTAAALEPISCPAGAPIASFRLLVTDTSGSAAPRALQSQNQLLAGYHIQYRPVLIKGPDKKKARISLVLVPTDKGSTKGKVVVLDPKPADVDADWVAPSETAIAALVFGPQGLDKGKVAKLVKKNDELVAQLADYAQKTQQTESLIQAITEQQQSLDTGESVNAAVVSFANQYPGAPKLDRTQPVDAQMSTLLHGLNPALSSYDPLAQDPMQRAAQSASIAAAVAGLFFGADVGLGASAGALLFNMHSLFFPRTEFRSAFAQTPPDAKDITALCGSRTASASRTQLAFLWATRLPDAAAPTVSLPTIEHLALGQKSTIPLEVSNWKLAPRIQDWRLISADGKTSAPVAAKVNTENKSVELDPGGPKLKPGAWKLAARWDWTPLDVKGEIELHRLSSFSRARVDPKSQDHLTQGAGKVIISLTGDDFEFVNKLSWKNCDDKFAQPSAAPFILPKGPHAGAQDAIETEIDTRSLAAGNYQFLLAQSDGAEHPVPFKVLPAPPQISNLPLLVNTGESTHITLRGSGLDRIESLSAEGARIETDEAHKGDERGATVTLQASVHPGVKLTVRVKVKDFDQPIAFTDALTVAGPRPAIGNIRLSLPPSVVALVPGEIPADAAVSLTFGVTPETTIDSVNLYCAQTEGKSITIQAAGMGESRLRQEGSGVLFLSFKPGSVGQPGCDVMARAHSTSNGDSAPKQLGRIVLLPKIESFQLGDEKAADGGFYGEIRGKNLESIAKAGWNSDMGITIEAIPAPVAGGGDDQTLKLEVPWPAPAPHAPLYIWLRGEEKGRATTVKW
jgi:hypothetical protein